MNQLWLRTFIGDPGTGTIVRRFPQHPLPENLRVSQLRSYLEQRFGPPIAEHVAGHSYMEFVNPDPSSREEGTCLVAIPLIADPRTQDLVSVFEKLEQFADLAEALGTARKGARPTEASRIWVGPLFNHRHLFQQINDLAAQAARALLLGAGLKGEIDKVIEAGTDTPIPIEALDEAMRQLDQCVTLAVNAADSSLMTHQRAADLARALAGPEDTHTIERLHDEERRLILQHNSTLESSLQCERITRDIAQLAFGISACASGPLVERLDRAGVAVLHPPRGSGQAVPLHEDGLTLRSKSERELAIELAGVICRILVDRRTVVSLLLPGLNIEGIYMEVDAGTTLLLTAHTGGDATRRALMESSDWREEEPGILVQRWPSPMRVIVPATLIAKALFGPFGLEAAEALEVSVVAAADAEVESPTAVEPESHSGVM